MRVSVNRLIVAIGCGLSLAGLSACSSSSQPGLGPLQTEQRRTVNFQENSLVSTLVVKGQTSDVRVSSGGPGVSVAQAESFQTTAPIVSHTLTDGVLTLSYSCSDPDCAVDYTVEVPTGTAVRISDGTGDITLSDLTAQVQAQTGTGQIIARGLSSSRAEFTTGTGDIQADFTHSPSALSANASTGDVRLSVPTDQYAVNAQAATGQVTVSVNQDKNSGNVITVKVGTGDVTVSASKP